MIDTITVGDAIAVLAVIFTAGATWAQVHLLSKRFGALEKKTDDHLEKDNEIHKEHGEKIVRLEALIG